MTQQQGSYEQVRFSVDLVEACLRELDLLDEVDGHSALLATPGGGGGGAAAVRRAIRRYEQCWLPLAAARQSNAEALAPALDVHWVWHCHMLAPYSYEADVTRLVGRVVNHRYTDYRLCSVAGEVSYQSKITAKSPVHFVGYLLPVYARKYYGKILGRLLH